MSLEAQNRGYKLFHYTPDRLSMRDGRVYATVEPMELRDVKGDHFTLGAPERIDLSTMDVVLLRQDPPFDMSYITRRISWSASIPRRWSSMIGLECATRRRRSSSPNSPT